MITIKEIAEIAGVTPTTVSNVLHGKNHKVSKATIEKIQTILKEKNYVPRLGLNALQNRGSGIIGILINTPDFAEGSSYELPFYSSVIGILENNFRQKGYYTMIFSSKDVEEIEKMVMGWNVEGIIAVSMPEMIVDSIERHLQKPVISIDLDETDERLIHKHPGVMSKDYEGGRIMCKYLLKSGIQEVVYVTNSKRGADLRRFQGARDYYREKKGPSARISLIQLPHAKKERMKMYSSFKRYVGKNIALFFSSDLNAVEAIKYFMSNNIKIPDYLSIVGFDNNIYAQLSYPGLTTIQSDVSEKAKWASEMLLEMLMNEETVMRFKETDVCLIERDSVKIGFEQNL